MIHQGRRTCRICYRYTSNVLRFERAQRTRARVQDWSSLPHGTASTYSNYGCRCDPCRAAKAAARKALKLRRAALDASEVALAEESGTARPAGYVPGEDPAPPRTYRPAFVDNDARPIPTTRKDVPVQDGVL